MFREIEKNCQTDTHPWNTLLFDPSSAVEDKQASNPLPLFFTKLHSQFSS
jgi:hypothetical protein